MYGVIIAQHPNSIRVLLCVLASVTYASDWLVATSGRYPGHPLSAVPLLKNSELTKITIKPSNLLSTATGIPPVKGGAPKSGEKQFRKSNNYL
jgi:hypothetical protein